MSDISDPEDSLYDEEEDFLDDLDELEEIYNSDSDDVDCPTAPKSFKVLNPEQLVEDQKRLIEHVSEVLSLPYGVSSVLLRHFKWSSDVLFEKYYDSPDTVLNDVPGAENASVGFDYEERDQIQQQRQQKQGQNDEEEDEEEEDEEKLHTCNICFDDFPASEIPPLKSCGHRFCKDCWKQMLIVAVGDGPKCIFQKCPEPACTTLINEIVFKDVLGSCAEEKEEEEEKENENEKVLEADAEAKAEEPSLSPSPSHTVSHSHSLSSLTLPDWVKKLKQRTDELKTAATQANEALEKAENERKTAILSLATFEQEREYEESKSSSSSSSVGKGKKYRVLFDYVADGKDELSLKENEIVTVIKDDDDGWWECRNESGECGVAPSNYLDTTSDYLNMDTDMEHSRLKSNVDEAVLRAEKARKECEVASQAVFHAEQSYLIEMEKLGFEGKGKVEKVEEEEKEKGKDVITDDTTKTAVAADSDTDSDWSEYSNDSDSSGFLPVGAVKEMLHLHFLALSVGRDPSKPPPPPPPPGTAASEWLLQLEGQMFKTGRVVDDDKENDNGKANPAASVPNADVDSETWSFDQRRKRLLGALGWENNVHVRNVPRNVRHRTRRHAGSFAIHSSDNGSSSGSDNDNNDGEIELDQYGMPIPKPMPGMPLSLSHSNTRIHHMHLPNPPMSLPLIRSDVSIGATGVGRTVTEPKQMTAKEALNKYLTYLVQSYVDQNAFIKWCPAVDCTYAVSRVRTTKSSGSVVCRCGAKFCFNCLNDEHWPLTCDQLKDWNMKSARQGDAAKWIQIHTKNCPSCGSNIEKNGGCNHMVCWRCDYEFCWQCLGNWKFHGSLTGGYDTCTKFKGFGAMVAESKKEKLEAELKRAEWYEERVKGEERTHKYAMKQASASAHVLESIQERYSKESISLTDLRRAQIINAALNQIAESRRLLIYTYIYLSFLKEGCTEFDLVEFLQTTLSKHTDHLSELVEQESGFGVQNSMERGLLALPEEVRNEGSAKFKRRGNSGGSGPGVCKVQ